jgi:hypothetical protein
MPPLADAVRQAGSDAGRWLADLQRYAEGEATALASGNYRLTDLATAPVRLLTVLATNTIASASTASDNLALIALTGKLGSKDAKRAILVSVKSRKDQGIAAPLPGDLELSVRLVGQVTGYTIPSERIHVDRSTLSTNGVVRIVVRCAAVPPDIYTGTLCSPGQDPLVSQRILVAINEIGRPVK